MVFRPSDPDEFERTWAIMDYRYVPGLPELGVSRYGYREVQWDGGSASIHGHSTRRLPEFVFSQLWRIPEEGTPALTFEILAEGYSQGSHPSGRLYS
jgi:hypothetical protein